MAEGQLFTQGDRVLMEHCHNRFAHEFAAVPVSDDEETNEVHQCQFWVRLQRFQDLWVPAISCVQFPSVQETQQLDQILWRIVGQFNSVVDSFFKATALQALSEVAASEQDCFMRRERCRVWSHFQCDEWRSEIGDVEWQRPGGQRST